MAKFETNANVKGLVGNKCDLTEQRVVSEQQGNELAAQLGCKYWETSAKTSIRCDEPFLSVAQDCFDAGYLSGPPVIAPANPTTDPPPGPSPCRC